MATKSLRKVTLPYGSEVWNGTSDSILSSLYRVILFDLNIEEPRWRNLVDKYVTRVAIPLKYTEAEMDGSDEMRAKIIEDISSTRTNTRDALQEPTMTWSVFIKGVEIINVRKMKLSVDMDFSKEDVQDGLVVTKTINLNRRIKPKEGEFDPETGGEALSAVFRDVLFRRDINTTKFTELLNAYIKRMNITPNPENMASIRGNHKKSFLSDRMSWAVFVKSLSFLGVKKFEIVLTLYHENGRTTVHNRTISLEYTE